LRCSKIQELSVLHWQNQGAQSTFGSGATQAPEAGTRLGQLEGPPGSFQGAAPEVPGLPVRVWRRGGRCSAAPAGCLPPSGIEYPGARPAVFGAAGRPQVRLAGGVFSRFGAAPSRGGKPGLWYGLPSFIESRQPRASW